MKIAVGSDHAGFHLKEHVKAALEAAGHDVVDVGTDSPESVDYPAYAEEAARLVADGDAERAVLACGSGVGVAIVANKIDGRPRRQRARLRRRPRWRAATTTPTS